MKGKRRRRRRKEKGGVRRRGKGEDARRGRRERRKMEDREKVGGRGEAEETYCLCSIVGVYTSFSMVVRRLEGEGDVSMCLRMGDGIREEGILSAVWRRVRGKSVST